MKKTLSLLEQGYKSMHDFSLMNKRTYKFEQLFY